MSATHNISLSFFLVFIMVHQKLPLVLNEVVKNEVVNNEVVNNEVVNNEVVSVQSVEREAFTLWSVSLYKWCVLS